MVNGKASPTESSVRPDPATTALPGGELGRYLLEIEQLRLQLATKGPQTPLAPLWYVRYRVGGEKRRKLVEGPYSSRAVAEHYAWVIQGSDLILHDIEIVSE